MTVSGYANFGPIKIPPRPMTIVLTDRTTLLKWVLSFDSVSERISISSDLSAMVKVEGAFLYAPGEGPFLDDDGEYRLLLDNGRLLLAYDPFPTGIIAFDGSPIYAKDETAQRLVNIQPTNPTTVHLGYVI